jgi:hypothetical protein
VAYKTEIQVKVDGLSQVKKLEETLARVNSLTTRINKQAASKIVDIGRTNAETKALSNLNRELERTIALQGKASRSGGGGKPGGGGGGGKPGGGVNRAESVALGVGFPLLFGGGAGQVLGGLAGSFVGSGFGGQILGSAIGGQIEDAIARTAELGRALESLDLTALADSTLLVNAELREAIQSSIDLGESQKAVEAIAKETLLQTGLFPENIQDATNAATLLSNVWDELVGSVSGLLSVLATPFLSALTAILSLVNAVVKGVNTVVGLIGKGLKLIVELLGKIPGINRLLAFLKENTEGVNEAEEKRIFNLKQSTKELEKELALDNELLAIEQRRTAGTGAAAKLNGAQVKRDLALRKLYAKTEKDIVKVRQEFGNTNSQILKDELFAKEIAVLRLATNEKTRILNQYTLDEKAAGLQREKEIEKELKQLEKERLEIRARESKIGQTRIQTQLNELANEEKIFQIRQQTAAASLQLDRARLDAQLSLLQLQESRLQRELDGLQKLNTNFERQRKLVDAIARNRANQAKIENQVAKVQAQQGVRQAKIALQQVKFQVQRIDLEIQLQRIKAQGEKDDNVRLAQLREINAIARQNQELTSVMLSEGRKQVNIAAQIAGEQKKVADNILKGKLESIEAERVEARRAINAKELAKATGQAADEAARLNSSMSSGGGASGGTVSTSLPIDPDVRKAVMDRAGPFGYRSVYELIEKLEEAQKIKNARTTRTAQMSQPSSSSFASSSSYAPRSSSGSSSGTTSVNISTGPVLEFDGKRYMTMDDFERGVAELAGAQAQRARSYGSRRYGGIS